MTLSTIICVDGAATVSDLLFEIAAVVAAERVMDFATELTAVMTVEAAIPVPETARPTVRPVVEVRVIDVAAFRVEPLVVKRDEAPSSEVP